MLIYNSPNKKFKGLRKDAEVMKKRILALVTALICLFALASCENETAYSLYSGSVEKLNAAGGYEMNADVDIAITIGSQTVEGSMQMNLKANGNNAAKSAGKPRSTAMSKYPFTIPAYSRLSFRS